MKLLKNNANVRNLTFGPRKSEKEDLVVKQKHEWSGGTGLPPAFAVQGTYWLQLVWHVHQQIKWIDKNTIDKC